MANQFKLLRERSGLSMDQLAKAAGYSYGSALQRYESPDYRKKYLPRDFVEKIAKPLVGKGSPAITVGEVFALAGIGGEAGPALAPTQSTAVSVPLLDFGGEEYASLPVYDLRLSAGPGAFIDDESEPMHRELYRHQWLRTITRAPIAKLIIARVSGDSMWETLHDGDHVIVDLTQARARRDGIYGLRREDEMIVKRITVDPRNGRLTISGDNPKYETYRDVNPDDLAVIGRVIWLGRQV